MAAPSDFCTTQWSVVRQAGTGAPTTAQAALERLCTTYWPPVYAYIRRQGHQPEDAEDLTQEFFADLLHRGSLAHLDRSRGKFRSFLIACLKHFLAKDWRARKSLKRGHGQTIIPIDGVQTEERHAADWATETDPAAAFDRRWALTILDQALTQLREEQVASGQGRQFEELRPHLTANNRDSGYDETARRLAMSPGAVATAVCRLRRRYRDLVRAQVTQTVTTPLELDDEMSYLLRVLSH